MILFRLKDRYVTAQMIGHRSNQFEDTPKVDVRTLRTLGVKQSLVFKNLRVTYY